MKNIEKVINDLESLKGLGMDGCPAHIKIDNAIEAIRTEYKRGLNDAWEIACELRNMTSSEFADIFNDSLDVVFAYGVEHAISKLKAYEGKKTEIIVGDVVTVEDGRNYVVTKVDHYGFFELVDLGDGSICGRHKDYITKTGKHYDLKKMFDLDNDRKE